MRSTQSTFLAFAMASLMLLTAHNPSALAAVPTPSRFQVGTLHVQARGHTGAPMILIPGLGSGPWVWQDTVAKLEGSHRIYVLTLAGFDGTQPPDRMTGLMDQVDASLLKLITSHKIDRPVLVGHSLGGTLAIGFAEKHPDLISGVVAVDGMPIFPGFERMSAEQRKAAAANMQQSITQASPEQFRQQQAGYMQTMGVIDADAANKYGKLQGRSNPRTVAQFMYEDLTTDLRPDLASISVPVMEISPYNAPDFKAAAASGRMPMLSEQQKVDYYRQLLKGTPELQVISIAPARHFAMLDQPEKFTQALEAFLADLKVQP
ncbi:MAG: alpha/beta hydrolase [Rhodanobacteraceae bacterium]